MLPAIVLLLACLGQARWVTRYVWRSDFFCATTFESYEASEEGACWPFNGSEWRRARMNDTSGVAMLERFGDANCSGAPLEPPEWSAAPNGCESFGPASENTFFGVRV